MQTGAASECNAACVAEPTCNAAVHFGGAKKCWLKAQPLSEIESTFKGYLKVLVGAQPTVLCATDTVTTCTV